MQGGSYSFVKKCKKGTENYYLNRPIMYIKIQPDTIDLSTKLRGRTTEFMGIFPLSLELRSIALS